MKHVMADLETLGNGPNSVIIAIGAVKFNTQGIVDKFYVTVDPQSCIDIGLDMDASTTVKMLVRSGTYHCAVDDAQSQAEHLIQIAKVKGIPL